LEAAEVVVLRASLNGVDGVAEDIQLILTKGPETSLTLIQPTR